MLKLPIKREIILWSYVLASSSNDRLVEIIVFVFGVIKRELIIVNNSSNLAAVRFSVPKSSITKRLTLNKLSYSSFDFSALLNL